MREAKQLLFSTYDNIKGEELMEKVQRVQAAQGEKQYGEAWRVINEMTEYENPWASVHKTS